EARARGADLLVGTELVVSGYPPEDLVFRASFLDAVEAAVEKLAQQTSDGPGIVLGAPWRDGAHVHNAVLLLDGGKIVGRRFKHHLPNYGVFDEQRVFAAGPAPGPMTFRGIRLGVMICED